MYRAAPLGLLILLHDKTQAVGLGCHRAATLWRNRMGYFCVPESVNGDIVQIQVVRPCCCSIWLVAKCTTESDQCEGPVTILKSKEDAYLCDGSAGTPELKDRRVTQKNIRPDVVPNHR